MNASNIALLSSPASDTSIYTFKHPYPQRFSLPFDVIKYIIKNCKSAKVWKKLIMLCKHFYPKKSVFPVNHLDVFPVNHFDVDSDLKCEADGELFIASKLFQKLWLYDSLTATRCSKVSTLILKIFKFDLHALQIKNQSMTFNDYQKITSSGSVERIFLWHSTIKNADDTIITADKLLEGLDNLQTFSMSGSNNFLMLQTETVKKIVQHLNGYKKMRGIKLCGINESFDFASFSDFLLNNKTVNVYLRYGASVSAQYKEIVENIIKEITKNPSLKVPEIVFK